MRWGEFTDEHGITIRYRVWEAVGAPRGVIALLHGVGEHTGRYLKTAEAFAAAGWEVWADDHRGHGETGRLQHHGDLSQLGHLGPGGLRATIAAVQQFLGIARAAHPGLPFVLVGHSWGSLMGQIILNRTPELFDAVVFTGTAYRMPGYMNAGDLNAKFKTLGSTGLEWLSRDQSVAQAFVDDELTTSVPLMKLFGVADALRLMGTPAKHLGSDVPLLIMNGSKDAVGTEKSVRKLAQAYIKRSGLTDVTVMIYSGAHHEVFNETNQDEVRADLLAWLDERFPRSV